MTKKWMSKIIFYLCLVLLFPSLSFAQSSNFSLESWVSVPADSGIKSIFKQNNFNLYFAGNRVILDAGEAIIVGLTDVTADVKHQIMVTYDGNHFVLYLDGKEDGRAEASGLSFYKTGTGDITLYDHSLSLAEVKQQYSAGIGLLAEWNFEGDTEDASGNGNTLLNSPPYEGGDTGVVKTGVTFVDHGVSGKAVSFSDGGYLYLKAPLLDKEGQGVVEDKLSLSTNATGFNTATVTVTVVFFLLNTSTSTSTSTCTTRERRGQGQHGSIDGQWQ
jgi:hypothetical protein